MRSWEIRCSALRMYAVKAARSSQRETITTSSGSRSERHTWRSTKPSAPSTRWARRRNAAISASDWSAATRSRDIDTYIAAHATSAGSGRVGAGQPRRDVLQIAAVARVGELPTGAVAPDEPAHRRDLALAAQPPGVAAAGGEDPIEVGDRRDALPGLDVDQRRRHPVAGGQEAVLLDQLDGARLGPRGVGALELEAGQRLDERDDRRHVLHGRLAVHDPDLDRAVAGLQADVPPQERRVGDRAGAQQPID